MLEWTKEELSAIAEEENLYISIPNADGSMHKPTWIWIVQVGDSVYTRAYNGFDSKWYTAAKAAGHGHITVGGVEKDVIFEFPSDSGTIEIVDEGYKSKYRHYEGSYLDMMLESQARDASVKLLPEK